MSEKAAVSSIVLAFVVIASLGVSAIPAPYDDNARYIILAQSLVMGKGFHSLSFPGEPADTKTPPLYPLILAGLIFVFGYSLAALNASSVFFMASALGVFYLLMVRYEVRPILRIVALSLAAFNPAMIEYSRVAMSEAPFIFFTMASIYLLSVFESTGRVRHLYAGLLLALLASLVRYAGFFLPVSVVVILLIRRDYKKAVFTVLLCLMLALPWFFNKMGGLYTGQLTETFSRGTYLEPDSGVITAPEFMKRYLYEAAAYAGDVIPDIILPALHYIPPRTPFWPVKLSCAALFLILLCRGYLKILKKPAPKIITIFSLVYILLITLFPSYGIRYLLPLCPFIILFFICGIDTITGIRAARALILFAFLSLATSAPYIAEDTSLAWNGFSREYKNYCACLDYLKSKPDTSASIICRKPYIGYLLSGRKTMRYPYTADKDKMLKYIVDSGARYLIVDSLDVAGIYFSLKYLKPVVEQYRERFDAVFSLNDPETVVYRIRGPR